MCSRVEFLRLGRHESAIFQTNVVLMFVLRDFYPAGSVCVQTLLPSLARACTALPSLASGVCPAAFVTYYIRSGRLARRDVIVRRN